MARKILTRIKQWRAEKLSLGIRSEDMDKIDILIGIGSLFQSFGSNYRKRICYEDIREYLMLTSERNNDLRQVLDEIVERGYLSTNLRRTIYQGSIKMSPNRR
jgi:hypothetical protein